MKNYKVKGNLGESLFLYKILKLGIPVSQPFGDNQSYDFIIDINGKLFKVQVKTGRYIESKNSLEVKCVSTHYDFKNKKYHSLMYDKKDIDLFAFVCLENGKISLFPIEILKNKTSMVISYNNEKYKNEFKNFHKDYDYKKIIKKLANGKIEEIKLRENPRSSYFLDEIYKKKINYYAKKYNVSKENINLLIENKIPTKSEIEKYQNIPQYIIDLEEKYPGIVKSYKRAINSETGFRGVTINNNKNSKYKYKVYLSIGSNERHYIGKGNNAKKLAKLYDEKAVEILKDKAITNKLLGLL